MTKKKSTKSKPKAKPKKATPKPQPEPKKDVLVFGGVGAEERPDRPLEAYRPALISLWVERRYEEELKTWHATRFDKPVPAPTIVDVRRRLMAGDYGQHRAVALLATALANDSFDLLELVDEGVYQHSWDGSWRYRLMINFGLQGMPKWDEPIRDLAKYLD